MAEPVDTDILPRLWHRAALTNHPGDKALMLEAANLIKDLRRLFGDADGIEEGSAYRLGIRYRVGDPRD